MFARFAGRMVARYEPTVTINIQMRIPVNDIVKVRGVLNEICPMNSPIK